MFSRAARACASKKSMLSRTLKYSSAMRRGIQPCIGRDSSTAGDEDATGSSGIGAGSAAGASRARWAIGSALGAAGELLEDARDVLDDVRLALRSLSLASAAFAAASAAASSASRMAISSDDDSMCSMVASSSEAIVCITTMASCSGVEPLLTVMGRPDVDAERDELECTVTGCEDAGEDSIVCGVSILKVFW
jgi:hypothetical protein